ncbi:MAG: DUF616 domain-containing protein [Alphaproteobacteria bacterium]|nr:DUF616 domain-containing protein [Alphaproteobacteria bacterium]
MKFIYYMIMGQIYGLMRRLGFISEQQYRVLSKMYYRYKISTWADWHNFWARGRVKRYFNLRTKSRKMVIYTCLTGSYDALIVHDFLNPECDYICFTDDKQLLDKKYFGPWKIEPLRFAEMDNSKNNRWHKMHPHLLLDSYQSSLYIDSNINFKTGKVFEYIRSVPRKCFIALPRHARRDCIYDEARFVVQSGLDDKQNVDILLQKYRDDNFPAHFGLAENNVIFRRHSNPRCIKLMEDWWELFVKYSRRDQLSLFYLLWKEKIDFAFFSPYSFKKDHENFRIYKHKG